MPPNKELKLTKPGKLRTHLSSPRCRNHDGVKQGLKLTKPSILELRSLAPVLGVVGES